MEKAARGFTIVELLIVIVVIAILASITVIAYNGIQNRANDSSVKSDLSVAIRKFEIFKADNGYYPSPDSPSLLALSLKISKSAYATSGSSNINPFTYCASAITNPNDYAIVAKSKSGLPFVISSLDNSIKPYTLSWGDSAQVCERLGSPFFYDTRYLEPGYIAPNWQSWTGA